MGVDSLDSAIVNTLRDVGIACQRSACFRQCIDLQFIASVNFIGCAYLKSRVNKMVCLSHIGGTGSECTIVGLCDNLVGLCTEIVGSVLRIELREIPCTTVDHIGGTLHRRVGQLQGIVEVHFIECPLVLRPQFGCSHIDTVVIAEPVAVVLHIVVVGSDVVFLYIGDVSLRKTGVGSQLFDITVGKRVNVNPLVTTEQVIHGLVVDTLRELAFQTGGNLQMVELCIYIVDVRHCFLNVVVTALQQVACRPVWVGIVVGDVRSVDVVPVYLCGFVVATLPQVN